MKSNELRIGNYFLENGNIKKVNPNIIEQLFESESRKWAEPIPLTEENLLKLGFNTQYKKGWIGIDVKHGNGTTTDFVLSYPQRMGMWQTFFAFEYDGFRFVELQYIHQLQNLYFALTGSDLVFLTEP